MSRTDEEWTYRKHIRATEDGYVITEFLPRVPWAKKFNTISCAAGHHFYEGRWIAESRYLDDYARFWFCKGDKGGEPRRYSFWAADALLARHLVQPNQQLLTNLLPDLVANFESWETSRRDANGLFWQNDGEDGMEVSVGGTGYRATISGLVGLRARPDDILEVNPLAPATWEYFCLDQVSYRNRSITILWDKTGARYGRGKGLRVFVDGKMLATADSLQRVSVSASSPAGHGRTRATNGRPID